MRIDAHQHFWRFSEAEYAWIPPGSPIRKDFLPPDLAPYLKACRLDGSVAVQARQTLEETRWLLELADHYSTVKGVVGWVDLRSKDIAEQLATFSKNPKFVGVRHVLQDEPDAVMGDPNFRRGIAALQPFKLTYDLLVFAPQLPAAIELAAAFPNQPIVLDHIAKPPIAKGELSPWRENIQRLAKLPHVHCKLSGMVTEANRQGWKAADFNPYLDVVVEAFGVDRLLFGSDWPVALLAGTYAQVFSLVDDYCARMSEADRAKCFGGNAAKFYRLAQN